MANAMQKLLPDSEAGKLAIKRIYSLLGPGPVVLLPLRGKGKNGKAPIDNGWPKIPFEQTRTPGYQARLGRHWLSE